MIDDGNAIHYAAVERGTPVYSSDGELVGKVTRSSTTTGSGSSTGSCSKPPARSFASSMHRRFGVPRSAA